MLRFEDNNKSMTDLVNKLKTRSFTHLEVDKVDSLVWEVMEKVDRGEFAPKDFYEDRPQ